MTTQILDFIKTDHELYKQWVYGNSDLTFASILKHVKKASASTKNIIIVMPGFLKKNKLSKGNRDVLVIILKANVIVTHFYCNHPNYLFSKERGAEFQLIY